MQTSRESGGGYEWAAIATESENIIAMRNSLLTLCDALLSAGVPRDKVRAVVNAMERCMATPISTAAQMRYTTPAPHRELKREFTMSRHENELTRKRMQLFLDSLTLRFGCILAIGCSLFYLAMKLT